MRQTPELARDAVEELTDLVQALRRVSREVAAYLTDGNVDRAEELPRFVMESLGYAFGLGVEHLVQAYESAAALGVVHVAASEEALGLEVPCQAGAAIALGNSRRCRCDADTQRRPCTSRAP